MHCGQHIDADDDLSGQIAECPGCHHSITIPVLPLTRTSRIKRIAPPPTPAHLKHNLSAPNWARVRINFLKACCFAFCLGLFHSWFRPKTALEMYMPSSQLGIFGFVMEALGWLLGAVVISLAISLFVALVLIAFKKPFTETWMKYFPIGIAGIAALAYLMLFLQ
jgi:hypothetical protein